jgi:diguanylate cyclase (GGDEF)-like protein
LGLEEARHIRTALNGFPSFQIHGTRDFDEARELLGSRTFDVAIVEGSSADQVAAAFIAWLSAERPEVALLRLGAPGETPAADGSCSLHEVDHPDVLASHIVAAIRTAGSVRRRETMVRWLEQESRVDHLTGLYNRTMFYDRLNEVCGAARTPGTPVTLIVLDVVGTRMVNEAHGREAGDAIIQHAAAGITRSVRGADFAARIDGDDFGVIIPNADFELGQRIARRIAHELDRLNGNEWRGQLPVEVSFGVATGTDCSGNELFSAAMAELGRCKNRSLVLSEFPDVEGTDGPSVA